MTGTDYRLEIQVPAEFTDFFGKNVSWSEESVLSILGFPVGRILKVRKNIDESYSVEFVIENAQEPY